MSRWVYVVLAMLLGGDPAQVLAQRMDVSMGHAPVFPVPIRSQPLTIFFHAKPSNAVNPVVLFPRGFFSSPFWYPDYPDQPAPVQVAPPAQQVIVLQPAPVRPEENGKGAELLLIERRGDHFVRIRDLEQEGAAIKKDDINGTTYAEASVQSPSSARSSAPTVLVFLDGHREETPSYTIANGVLYEVSDYWSTGAWTKSVKLASLDLAATVRENELRGTKFLLPSGPNEITIRP